MPDEQTPSAVHPVRSFARRWALPCAGAFIASSLVVLGAMLMPAGSSASGSPAAAAAPAASPTARTPDASVLRATGLTPSFSAADGRAFAAMAEFARVAGQPTTVPPPPTATAAPPEPTDTPVERVFAPPPARPQPTSTPEPPPPAVAPAPSGLDTSPMDASEQALFDATNRRRVGSGLPPLRVNLALAGIARIRSHDMADHNYFAHTSPVTGDTAFSLMDAYGIPYAWAGENLAKNNYSAAEAVGVADQALWDSPPHRENILGANYTDMGIGLVTDAAGMHYFTIVFTGPA